MLFNNIIYLNAGKAEGPLPIHLCVKELLLSLWPEDFFLAWSIVCLYAGQAGSAGSLALTQTVVDQ